MSYILTIGTVLHKELTLFSICQGEHRYFPRETQVEIVEENPHGLRKLVKTIAQPPWYGWVGNELLEKAIEPVQNYG